MTTLDRIIHDAWQGGTLEALKDFIRIPAKSSAFDSAWKENGHLMAALEQARRWGLEHFPGATFEILESPEFPPALFVDIKATGTNERPVFYYGHLDKQPETVHEGWEPWNPVVRDGRLYGRGAVDDGYSFYTALTAAAALDEAGLPRPRVTGLFETNEESGSEGLEHYIDEVARRVKDPAYVAILDLGAMNLKRLWLTRSLRGALCLTVKVQVLDTAVHSGFGSGLAPDSFRIMRSLLSRIEDESTGRILLPELHAELPESVEEQMKLLIEDGYDPRFGINWHGGTRPCHEDPLETLKASCWDPTLTVVGAEGLPAIENAGVLIRPSTSLRLSIRIPPVVDGEKAIKAVVAALTTDVPYGASVTVSQVSASSGFLAEDLEGPVGEAVGRISRDVFEAAPGYIFCGASIGTLPLFGRAFPGAPFINTGALAPDTNAHAPFEYLPLGYAEKLTRFLAELMHSMEE